jgi:hypothetical protein
MRIFKNRYLALVFLSMIISVPRSWSEDSKYAFILVVPKSVEELGLSQDDVDQIKSLFTAIENDNTEDNLAENLRSIHSASLRFTIQDLLWMTRQHAKEFAGFLDPTQMESDPLFYQMMVRHHKKLFEEILGKESAIRYESSLVGFLKHPNSQVRLTSAQILLECFPSPASIEACRELLQDPDKEIISETLLALSMLRDETILPVLEKMQKMGGDDDFAFASRCLSLYGIKPQDKKRLHQIIQTQGRSYYQAVETLTSSPDSEDFILFLDLLKTTNRPAILLYVTRAYKKNYHNLSSQQIQALYDVIEARNKVDYSFFESWGFGIIYSAFHNKNLTPDDRLISMLLAYINKANVDGKTFIASMRIVERNRIIESLPHIANRLPEFTKEEAYNATIKAIEQLLLLPQFISIKPPAVSGTWQMDKESWIQWWKENKEPIEKMLQD